MAISAQTIRRITIQGDGQQSLDSLAGSLDKVTASQKRLSDSSNTTATVTDVATKRQLSAAEAYRRQTLAVVDGARAQDQLARSIRVADQALQQGRITADDHANRIAILNKKYGDAGQGAKALAAATSGMGQAFGLASGAVAAFGISLGAAALIEYGKAVFRTTADLQEQADQVLGAGGNVEALQAIRGVFLTNGIAMEAGDKIIARLTRTLGEAEDGSKKAQDAFHKLGLGAKDLAGSTADAALPLVAAHLLGIKDAAARAAEETAIFGKTGQQLESALTALAHPIQDLIKHAKDLGIVIDADMIKKADDAKDQMALSWMKLSVALAPVVTQWANDFTQFTNSINGSTGAIDGLITKLQVLIGVYAGARIGGAIGGLPGAVVGGVAGGVGTYAVTHPKATGNFIGNIGLGEAGYNTMPAANDNGPYNRGLITEARRNGGPIESVTVTGTRTNTATWKPTQEDLDAYKKIKETFKGYLDEVTEAARLAGQSAAQRETELSVIKAAQIAEKEHGVAARDTSKNYADASKYLGNQRTHLIEIQEAQKRVNQLGQQQAQQQMLINAGLAVDADHRALVLKNLLDEITEGVAVGAQFDDQRKQIEDRNRALQAGQDATGLKDYIAGQREELSLAGLSADERQRQEAILQQMHATHGTLTADQAKEIDGIIQAQQQTSRWRQGIDGIANSFQDFFQNVLTTGRASFGGLWDAIKAQFASMLSYMAAQALVTPIIIPMVQALGGFAGATNLSGGSSTGLLGGSGGGTLGLLSSGGSILSAGSSLGLFGSGGLSLGGIGSTLTSAINGVGSLLFGTPETVLAGGETLGGAGGGAAGLFGSAGLGAVLGGFGAGSLASSLIFGNKNDAGIGGMGGAAAGAILGSMFPVVGTLVGGLLGGVLGGGLGSITGSSNQGAISNFGDGGLSNYLFKQGGGNNGQLATQAASTISDAIKTLQGAGVSLSLGNITGLSIGSDKSYVYDSAGGKQKLAGGDVQAVVEAILTRILPTITGSTTEAQAVIAKYQANGGINSGNLSQLETDLGTAKNFADALASLKASGTQLSAVGQQLKQINDQYTALVDQAQQLGLDTANLTQVRDQALSDITDSFNDSVTDALNAILNGPLQQWNALVKQQTGQMDDAVAASADLGQLEQLQYLQRKQLLMGLNDSQRDSLEALIGLADDLAAKTVALQATAITAINKQIDASQKFADQQTQIASQYASASASLASARTGFLVDPNASRLSPADAYSQSRSQLDEAVKRGLGGDLDSLNSLGGLASTFLNNSLAVNATSSPYGDDFQHVQDVLAQAKAAADQQQTATLNQGQLALQQVTVLQAISTELQKPDPNTDVLNAMLDRLSAINGGLTSNANAIIATIQADPAAAAISALQGALAGSGVDQSAAIVGALGVLRDATSDGLITVAEAAQVRGALGTLQSAIDGQLAHQGDLSQGQLTSVLMAQAYLDQIRASIGVGLDVTNLAAVADPINQLVDLTKTGNNIAQTGASASAAAAAAAAAAAQAAAAAAAGDSVGAQTASTSATNLAGTTAALAAAAFAGNGGVPYTQPGVGSRSNGSEINAYADGTDFAPGGMAIVGEQGPELLRLGRGSAVTPNRQLRNLLGATNSNDVVKELRSLRAEVAALTDEMERTTAAAMTTAGGVQGLRQDTKAGARQDRMIARTSEKSA